MTRAMFWSYAAVLAMYFCWSGEPICLATSLAIMHLMAKGAFQ